MRKVGALVSALLVLVATLGRAGGSPGASAAGGARVFPSVPFVVGCGVSHESDDDPIIHPGMSGMSHHHVFFGNTSTNATSTVASLTKARTTCEDPADLASYWVPGPVGGGSWTNMRAYYVAGAVPASLIRPFPSGLQMVAGWKFDAIGLEQPSVTWSCGLLAEQSGWSVTKPSRCRAGTNVAVRIDFPQCWDGRTLKAGTNMARPERAACPAAYPVAVPMLRIRMELPGAATSLASGSFETMHADFWNAWEPDRLDQLVATCIRGERLVQREVRRCGVPGGGPRKG